MQPEDRTVSDISASLLDSLSSSGRMWQLVRPRCGRCSRPEGPYRVLQGDYIVGIINPIGAYTILLIPSPVSRRQRKKKSQAIVGAYL